MSTHRYTCKAIVTWCDVRSDVSKGETILSFLNRPSLQHFCQSPSTQAINSLSFFFPSCLPLFTPWLHTLLIRQRPRWWRRRQCRAPACSSLPRLSRHCAATVGPAAKRKSHFLRLFYFNLLLIELQNVSKPQWVCVAGADKVGGCLQWEFWDSQLSRNVTFPASSLFLFDFNRNFLPVSVRGSLRNEIWACSAIKQCHLVWGFLNISPPTSQVGMENKLSDSF